MLGAPEAPELCVPELGGSACEPVVGAAVDAGVEDGFVEDDFDVVVADFGDDFDDELFDDELFGDELFDCAKSVLYVGRPMQAHNSALMMIVRRFIVCNKRW